MYLMFGIGTMFVLPVASILIDYFAAQGQHDLLFLVGKWFVFWGLGVRLLVAGVSQAMRPGFTARDIFKIKDPEAENVVVELGYANIAMGLLATLSAVFPVWINAGALVGGVFLGLDGIRHMMNGNRSRNENFAMATDLWMAVIVLGYLALTLVRG